MWIEKYIWNLLEPITSNRLRSWLAVEITFILNLQTPSITSYCNQEWTDDAFTVTVTQRQDVSRLIFVFCDIRVVSRTSREPANKFSVSTIEVHSPRQLNCCGRYCWTIESRSFLQAEASCSHCFCVMEVHCFSVWDYSRIHCYLTMGTGKRPFCIYIAKHRCLRLFGRISQSSILCVIRISIAEYAEFKSCRLPDHEWHTRRWF